MSVCPVFLSFHYYTLSHISRSPFLLCNGKRRCCHKNPVAPGDWSARSTYSRGHAGSGHSDDDHLEPNHAVIGTKRLITSHLPQSKLSSSCISRGIHHSCQFQLLWPSAASFSLVIVDQPILSIFTCVDHPSRIASLLLRLLRSSPCASSSPLRIPPAYHLRYKITQQQRGQNRLDPEFRTLATHCRSTHLCCPLYILQLKSRRLGSSVTHRGPVLLLPPPLGPI